MSSKDLLGEYAKLAATLHHINDTLQEMNAVDITQLIDKMRIVERKMGLVYTFFKSSVYAVTMQAQEQEDQDDGQQQQQLQLQQQQQQQQQQSRQQVQEQSQEYTQFEQPLGAHEEADEVEYTQVDHDQTQGRQEQVSHAQASQPQRPRTYQHERLYLQQDSLQQPLPNASYPQQSQRRSSLYASTSGFSSGDPGLLVSNDENNDLGSSPSNINSGGNNISRRNSNSALRSPFYRSTSRPPLSSRTSNAREEYQAATGHKSLLSLSRDYGGGLTGSYRNSLGGGAQRYSYAREPDNYTNRPRYQ